tara:strand:+ start:1674 stop:2747 length:1074 start_codon:yes stop_codon:yes gene_type:complete
MPLGFAKSVLTQGESFELGYWKQTAAVNSGSGSSARFTYTSSGESNTHSFTYSCWFKCSSSDWDTNFDATEPMRIYAGDGSGLIIDIHKTTGLQALVFENASAGGTNIATTATPRGASWASTYIDDNWHHMFIQVRFNSGDLGQSRIFLDGEDCTFGGLSTTAPAADSTDDEINFWGRGTYVKEWGGDVAQVWLDLGTTTDWLGCKTTLITGATTAFPCVITSASHGRSDGDRVTIDGVGASGDAPISTVLNGGTWTVANKTTNTFELQGLNTALRDEWASGGYVTSVGSDTNIDKWRTSAGGPKDLGTTGTPAGLTQPDVYLYVNSSGSLVNGGAASGSLTEAGSGLTKSATGGPQ